MRELTKLVKKIDPQRQFGKKKKLALKINW